MKRRAVLTALLLIGLSLLAYGTIAYYTSEDVVNNVITTGSIKIELLEWADEDQTIPFPEEGIDGVMPNTKITKIVEVKNTGEHAAYVRIKLDLDMELLGTEDPDLNLLLFDFDVANWTLRSDGFHYYNTALAPGATTEALFSTVGFDASMGNEYQNAVATMSVKAYAVQEANQNVSHPWDATGWPAG